MTRTDERADGVGPRPRTARRRVPRRSRWTALLVAASVLAVLSPLAWLLSRPAPDAGVPLAEALAPAAQPAPSAVSAVSAPSGPSEPASADGPADGATALPQVAGEVAVRDASLDALAARRGPAPVRLQVPTLGIDAAVDAVGVEADGSMVVPAEVDRVGWYRYGPEAGAAEGNAVLAGHVDARGQGPGALFELREVPVGTEITVTDAGGTAHRYEVVSREQVTKDVLPVEQVFAREGDHRLVVITCGGRFQPELRSYTDNVVVTAVPVAGS